MSAPLILTGFQRSGTTALGSLIADHCAAAGGTFTVNGKLLYVLPRWVCDVDIENGHLRSDEIMHILLRKPPYGPLSQEWLGRTRQALWWAASQVADGAWPHGAVALRREIVRRAYQVSDAPWGEKYNEYLFDSQSVTEILPDARFLVVFRHPEDVATSMLRWAGDRPWRPTTLDGVTAKWAAWNSAWLKFLATDPSRPHLVVSYERLCTEPAARAAVAGFTGLDEDSIAEHYTLSTPRSPRDEVPAQAAQVWRELQAQEVL